MRKNLVSIVAALAVPATITVACTNNKFISCEPYLSQIVEGIGIGEKDAAKRKGKLVISFSFESKPTDEEFDCYKRGIEHKTKRRWTLIYHPERDLYEVILTSDLRPT